MIIHCIVPIMECKGNSTSVWNCFAETPAPNPVKIGGIIQGGGNSHIALLLTSHIIGELFMFQQNNDIKLLKSA